MEGVEKVVGILVGKVVGLVGNAVGMLVGKPLTLVGNAVGMLVGKLLGNACGNASSPLAA